MLSFSLILQLPLRAADLWWDTSGNGTWSTNTNWNTSADGSGSDPGSAPGASDTAYFNITTVNQAITANLTAALSIGGLVFNNTGNTSIRTNGAANRAITLGTSGITINSGAGNVTFGTATANQQVTFTLGGNQTWTNNSSNTLSLIAQNTVNTAGYGLTIGGSGNTTIASIISNTGSIIKNDTGTLTLSAANTFTGGLTLNSGSIITAVAVSSAALGNGTLTLNGGTLYLNYSAGSLNYLRPTTVGGDASIMSDRPADANLRNYTFGTLAIGANTLTVGGGNVSANGSTGIIFGATTLTGNATFNILNSTTGSPTTFTLGAITNQGYNVTLTGSGNLTMASTWNGTGGLTLGVSGGEAYNGTAALSTAKAFTGNVVINSGTITNGGTAYALGNGSVFLGDTTGNNSARLNFNNSNAVIAPSNLTVQAGSTGNVSLTSQTSGNPITWSGNVTLNRSLTLAQTTNNTLTISGTISGAGGLNIGDSNITNNSNVSISGGNNTFTGQTVVNSGTLLVSNTSALQNSTLKMNGGALTFNAAAGNFTFGGLAADSSGAGYDLVLQNATSTAITLIVGNNNGTSSYAGVLSGAGNFTKSGTGTQTLSGNNTYTGTTRINAGLLEIGAAGRLGGGSYAGNITNNATFIYSGTNAQTLSGVISGTGALTQNASSTLTLSGNNSYSGGSTLNAGTLVLGHANGLGNGTISFGGGALQYDSGITTDLSSRFSNTASQAYAIDTNGNNVTFATALTSSGGTLAKSGAGTLILTGANTYTGTTTINAGTLQIGAGGTSGSIASTSSVTNNATLLYNRSDALTASYAISGTGALAKSGDGTLILTGANTYTGATTINAGTLQIGAGGTSGSIASTSGVTNNATLAYNRSDALTVSYPISGTGDLVKSGVGTLTISGNNTYSGATTVNAGTLNVSGNIATSATTVNSGATLTGSGTAGAITLNTGGLIGAGADTASVGMLTGTSLTIGAGTGYTLTIGNVNASVGGTDYDQISLGGALSLNNTFASPFTVYLYGTPTGWSGTGTYSWDIITAASLVGAITAGNFTADFTNFGIASGNRTGTWTFSNPTAGNISLTYTGPSGVSVWSGASGNWSAGFSPALSNNGSMTFTGAGGTATNDINENTLSRVSSISFDSGAGSYTLVANSNAAGGSAAVALSMDSSIVNNSGSSQAINLALDFSSSRTVETASGNITIGGVVSGAGGITKTGNDTLTLSAANTYTGATAVNAGTLTLTGGSAIVDNGAVSVASGAVLNLGASETIGTISGVGNITLGAYTLTSNASSDTTFSGVMSGTGGLTKNGTATLTLSGANIYTGATAVNAGTLSLTGGSAIVDNGAVSVANGAVLNLGASETIGTIAGAGDVTLGTYTLTTNASSDTTFSGVMSGTGGLTKNGTATLTLSGANTYTGTTTIDAGTLALGASQSLGAIAGSGNISLSSYNLTMNASSDTTFSGVVSGTGGLTKNGAGTTTLSGGNSYTGATTINAGTLQIGSGGTTGSLSTSSAIANTGTLAFNRSNTVTQGTDFSGSALGGSGALAQLGSGSLVLTANNTYTGSTTINAGTLEIAAAGRLGGGNYSATISNNGTLIYSGTNNQSLTGVMSGTGGLTMNGSGALTINASNTYTGGTVLNSGTLVLSNAAALGNGTLTLNGGSLNQNIGSGVTVSNNIAQIWNGNFTVINSAAINIGLGAVTVNDNLTITVNGNIFTVGGTINAAGLNLTKEGAGTLTLGNANSTVSSWTINGGTLRGGTNTGTFGYGATLNLVNGTLTAGPNSVGANDFSTNALNVLGNFTLNNNNSSNNNPTTWYQFKSLAIGSNTLNVTASGSTVDGNISIRDGVTLNGNATINVTGTLNAMTFTSNGSVVESGGSYGLTKAGNGTLRLVGAGNYTGDTVISGGVLEIQNVAASTISGNTTLNGNTVTLGSTDGISIGQGVSGTGIRSGSYILAINAANSTITLSQNASAAGSNISLTFAQTSGSLAGSTLDYDNQGGSINFGQSTAITLGGLKGNQSLSLTNNNTTAVALTIGGNNQTTAYGGVLSGNGSLVKAGSGTLTLSGNNTYTGGTNLNAGTLVIGNTSAAGTGTITQANGTSLLTIGTTGTIANAMSVYNVAATETSTLSGAITVNNATFDVETDDTLTISGAVSGSGGVTKTGDGTLVLSGSNSYSSATTVNAGTLNAANANALGSNATIQVNGGSLLVTADDAINGKAITLNSTSTTVAGLAFSGTYNGTAGLLTLSQNSVIDLGEGSVVLHFTSLVMGLTNTLSIYNWTGTTLWGGGNGNNTDQFYVDRSLSDSELNRISFYSGGLGTSSFVGTGYQLSGGSFNNEVIPVPEPETWVTGVILILGGVIWLWRQKSRKPTCLGF
jgi:autotransporter-associated beta strand protein